VSTVAWARLLRAPLWARLVAGTLLLVTLALAVTGVVGIRLLRGYLEERVDKQLELAAVPFRQTAPPRQRPDEGRSTQRFFGLFYVVVLDPAGNVLDEVSVPTTEDRPRLPRLTVTEATRLGGRPFTVGSASTSGAHWRVVAVPVADGRTRVAAVSLAEAESTVSRMALIDVGVGAVVLLLLGLAGYLLVRVSLRSLVEMEYTAETIAAGDLSRRVAGEDAPAEVARLGRALNGMLAQIELAFQARETSEESARRSEDRMRRFVADASHELRTPLTSIRGFAELYRQERGDEDPEVARLLRRIEDEAARMGLLVEDLLLLARMDQQRPVEFRPVDVLSLAADAVLDAQALAPDRDIALVRLGDTDAPLIVMGDEARLRQVVGNLVANALTHTSGGTSVRVGAGTRGRGTVVLEVADEGPGLAVPDAERVFERFFRADPSRNRNHGGSGLGLSIVAALVHAHGGTVEVETAPGRGATFRVLLRSALADFPDPYTVPSL
jgi:two-component system OmpR family sensor kinase